MLRHLTLLAAAAAALALAGCGSTCDSSTCTGCCDANAVCQQSTEAHCGLNGVACAQCVGAQTCSLGTCQNLGHTGGGVGGDVGGTLGNNGSSSGAAGSTGDAGSSNGAGGTGAASSNAASSSGSGSTATDIGSGSTGADTGSASSAGSVAGSTDGSSSSSGSTGAWNAAMYQEVVQTLRLMNFSEAVRLAVPSMLCCSSDCMLQCPRVDCALATCAESQRH